MADYLYLAAVIGGVPLVLWAALFAVTRALEWYERVWLD